MSTKAPSFERGMGDGHAIERSFRHSQEALSELLCNDNVWLTQYLSEDRIQSQE